MFKWLLALVLLSTIANAATVAVFLSPDNSYSTLKGFLSDSNELKIASYTFNNLQIMDDLIRERIYGASVTLLIEASPAGGLGNKEILCELTKNNINVFLYDGPYRFMHAKYVIKDNEVLVSTENFGNNGFPITNYGNRGWSVIIEDESIVNQLSAVFDEDLKNSHKFACDLDNYTINYGEKDEFDPSSSSHTYSDQDVELIIAPDAVDEMLNLINSAEESIYVEQFYIYRYWDRQEKTENLMLEAVIDKAREGLDVKILMDSYWYNVEEDDPVSNLYTYNYVNEIAGQESLSMEARLADLSLIGVEKLHLKGMVIDDAALISSINWNENSPRNNREIGIVVRGESADYFADAFMRDWEPGRTGPIIGNELVLIIVAISIVVVLVAWRKH